MSKEEMLAWIAQATYQQLLQKWRFEPISSPWFGEEICQYLVDAMKAKRPDDATHTAISKVIGWDK